MSNVGRVRQHLSDDSSCGLCDAAMEDINHIFCFSPMDILICVEFVRLDKITDFFGLNMHDWLVANLVHDSCVAKGNIQWDIMLGSLVWNIWIQINMSSFESFVHYRESIMVRSHWLSEEMCSMVRVLHSLAPSLAHVVSHCFLWWGDT
ncbi:hypothetical protein V6N11_013971 [Hibiscus sabdariffa]